MKSFPIKLPLGAGVVEISQLRGSWSLRFVYNDGTLCPVERADLPLTIYLWELTADGPVRTYAVDMRPQTHYQVAFAGEIPEWLLPQMERLRHTPEVYTMAFSHAIEYLPKDRQLKPAREAAYSGTRHACRSFIDVIDDIDAGEEFDQEEIKFLRSRRKTWNREIVKVDDDLSILVLHTML